MFFTSVSTKKPNNNEFVIAIIAQDDPFTIPKKNNCDLCRIKTDKRKTTDHLFLDQL